MISEGRRWFVWRARRVTVPQIATFTGHSLKDVEAILDAHYLGHDVQLAAPRSGWPDHRSKRGGYSYQQTISAPLSRGAYFTFINGCVNQARIPMLRCAFPGDRGEE